MKTAVVTLENKKAGEIDLVEAIFGVEVRADILARMVNWQLAKRRSGTRKTKGRSEIRGSTAKIYRQKGTGRARHGTKKVVQFRGGGVVFGPVVRDHNHKLTKKLRKLALCTALASKVADGKLVVLESTEIKAPKTGDLAKRFRDFGWSSVLIIDGDEVNENFARAARNIPGVDVLPQQGANVYDIVRRDTLVLTRAAVEKLQERLQ